MTNYSDRPDKTQHVLAGLPLIVSDAAPKGMLAFVAQRRENESDADWFGRCEVILHIGEGGK